MDIMATQTLDAPPRKRLTKSEKQARQTAEARRVTAELLAQIQQWIAPLPGWNVSEQDSHNFNNHPVSPLVTVLDTPKGQLVLEPLGVTFGSRAVVDFYVWPQLYRVRLLNELNNRDGWRVRTDSGIYLREDWSRENFLRLANDLMTADWD